MKTIIREFITISLEKYLAITESSSFVRTMNNISNDDLARVRTCIDKLKKGELE